MASAFPDCSSKREAPRVLIVEDDEDTHDLYSGFLADLGYSVVGASNGAEAVSAARREMPDLILMDLQLPGLDGLEAARQIRADPCTRYLPILALTGFVQRSYIAAARTAGCDRFLTKPCSLDRLLDEVRCLLGMQREPDAPRLPIVDEVSDSQTP